MKIKFQFFDWFSAKSFQKIDPLRVTFYFANNFTFRGWVTRKRICTTNSCFVFVKLLKCCFFPIYICISQQRWDFWNPFLKPVSENLVWDREYKDKSYIIKRYHWPHGFQWESFDSKFYKCTCICMWRPNK